jgi:hypothetical protein
MKKLIILPLILGIILVSCKKENTEPNKQSAPLTTETLNFSKVKIISNGLTLVTTLDNKTGEVSIQPEKGEKTLIYVSYKAYKETNSVFQPLSSMNPTKYLNKFVIMAFSSIAPDTRYKVELNISTSNGGNNKVTVIGKKK